MQTACGKLANTSAGTRIPANALERLSAEITLYVRENIEVQRQATQPIQAILRHCPMPIDSDS
jgi:hypothetical protein